MAKTNLDIAKEKIKELAPSRPFGIFNTRNIVGDPMTNVYAQNGLRIDVCDYYEYIEVFGLTPGEFEELAKYYHKLVD